MVAFIEHTHENTDLVKVKLSWSVFCTNTGTRMCGIRLGGSGGMLSQEEILKI